MEEEDQLLQKFQKAEILKRPAQKDNLGDYFTLASNILDKKLYAVSPSCVDLYSIEPLKLNFAQQIREVKTENFFSVGIFTILQAKETHQLKVYQNNKLFKEIEGRKAGSGIFELI